jgi:broad specificity phosphatase PhoE
MPNLSRRHLVTTAAALPALAMPAVTSDATGPNHPDAKLLRLGAEFEAIIVDWHAQRAIDSERRAGRHTVIEDGEPWEDIHGRIWPLIDAIMAHKPQTVVGLGVLARAFTLDHAEQWESVFVDGQHHRAFMEAVCAIAGVVPVPTEAVQS